MSRTEQEVDRYHLDITRPVETMQKYHKLPAIWLPFWDIKLGGVQVEWVSTNTDLREDRCSRWALLEHPLLVGWGLSKG